MFNLTVDVAHEYFASGFLVSNCDAFLYAYSKATAYLETAPEPVPEYGTVDYWKRDTEARKEKLIADSADDRPAYERMGDDNDNPWGTFKP